MMKFFLCSLLALLISFSLFAQEKALGIFEAHALSQTEIAALLNQYPELNELNVASMRFVENADGSFALKLYAQDTNDVYVVYKAENIISISKSTLPYEVVTKPFSGTLEGSLFETIFRDCGNERIASQMAESFKDDLGSLKGLKIPASYDMEVIGYYENGELIKYGNVKKASLLVGKALSERSLVQDLTSLNWELKPIQPDLINRPFYAPVHSSRVSSLFNLARRHPVKRRIQPHNGIDFVARSGTPVYPALEGEIIAMGRARAKGKFILIQHDNGYQTTYDHLKKFTKGLRVGMRVELNDQIGTVGRTGFATGAHLHFGVIREGIYVNPIYLVKDYTFDQKDKFENLITDTTEEEIEE